MEGRCYKPFSIDKHVDLVPVFVGSSSTTKYCRYYPNRLCGHNGCCGIFCLFTGDIVCCSLHPNPFGWFKRRKVSEVRS